MKVDVIIVNWNSGLQLLSCVQSILSNSSNYLGRIIVVDNGSSDLSEASIASMPNVLLLRMDSNLGFGRACNIGATKAENKYLLFLNPDARLGADTLDKGMRYMLDPVNKKVGICGVQLIDEQSQIARSCARFPTAFGFISHAIGFSRIFPKTAHLMVEWDHMETRKVDHVIGAFFMMKRDLFESLTGFDERFFVYLEDVDFSRRASLAGWESVYLAETQAFHAGGGTSNQVKALRLFYSLRSRLIFSFKHFSTVSAVAVLVATIFMEPFTRFALMIVRRSYSGIGETAAAYRMLFKWLPRFFLNNSGK